MVVENIIELIGIVFRLRLHAVEHESEVRIEQSFLLVGVMHIAAEFSVFFTKLSKGGS